MKILIVQTAFIGDVVLATPLVEKLSGFFQGAKIDFLLRKGNEELFQNHPKLNKVLTWDKKSRKLRNLWNLICQVRQTHYDLVVNLQRYWSTGLLTAVSGADQKIGFKSNPLSFSFDKSVSYDLSDGKHETERNLALIEEYTNDDWTPPKLYPVVSDKIVQYISDSFLTISPGSVWATKQLPKEKWIAFLEELKWGGAVVLLGAKGEYCLSEEIRTSVKNKNVINLCGELSMLESVAVMKYAVMNYVNDSAPLHFASAIDAPVCAVFCSTVPEFGFTPLSAINYTVQSKKALSCKPCGVHGYLKCPRQHFQCAREIDPSDLVKALEIAL